ncbi:MAG TPA: flagellin [Methylovirgula sp.]|jgi:flagellin|nr:flagellin [Methylovirgula sp.]
MSSSLLTNNAAMTALQSLNMTQQTLAKYENQVSTGLKINSAADNASYWSIATSMSSQTSALGAVSNALSESGSMLSTMSNALQQTVSVMDNIQNDLLTALQPGTDLTKIQTDIQTQQQMLLSYGNSATFNGQNLLANAGTASVNLVASYDQTNGPSYITIDTSQTALFTPGSDQASAAGAGILDKAGASFASASILSLSVTASGITTGDISNMLSDVQTALQSIESAASVIGADQTNVTDQQNFVSNLSDSLTSGVGALVDADMNQASTKISALQVQQQLGVQALGIANSNTQMILRLFQ